MKLGFHLLMFFFYVRTTYLTFLRVYSYQQILTLHQLYSMIVALIRDESSH